MESRPLKNMEEEKDVNLDTQNEETDEQELDDTEPEEPTEDDSEKVSALKEQNKKLFARAKKAEGFELKGGKWVKKEKEEKNPEPQQTGSPEGEQKDPEQVFRKMRDDEFIEDQGYSEETAQAIRDWAAFKGISAKKAAEASHIKALIGEEERDRANDDAALGKEPRRGRQTKTPTGDEPPKSEDYDLETEKGREDYEKARDAFARKQGQGINRP